MSRHAGEALELALALLRMPAQRHALRDRPLPADIDQILPIVAGSRDALATAAQATGEPERVILEAVQFYLQEVLFFPEADAYRILAVPHDAEIDHIQQHHRQLQRWLHPDRRGNDLESGFASRVNQAWNALRSQERRQAYDAMLQQQSSTTAANASITPTAAMGWHRMDAGPQARWRQALPLTLLAVAGVLLLALLVAKGREKPAFDEWQDEVATAAADLKDSGTAPAHVRDASSTSTQGTLSSAPDQRMQTPRRPASAKRDDLARPGDVRATDRQPPKLAALMPILKEPAAAQARVQLAKATANPTISQQGAETDLHAAASTISPAVGHRTQQATVDTSNPAPPLASGTSLASATRLRGADPAPMQRATPGATRSVAAAAPLPALQQTPPGPDAANGTPDLVERVRLARQRAQQVTAYLSDPRARTPPVWNDLGIQVRAERLRRNFQSSSARKRLTLQQPDWRISADDARLQAVYRCSGQCADDDQGVLRLQLKWRNDMWLVRDMDMERAR